MFVLPSSASTLVEYGEDSYRSPGVTFPPYYVREILRQVTQPLGNQDVGSVEMITKKAGGIKLDCLKVQSNRAVASKATGFFPTYCMEAGTDALLLSGEFRGEDITRAKVGNFRQYRVPMGLSIRAGGKLAPTGQVVQLQGRAEPYPENMDTTGLEKKAKSIPVIGNAGGGKGIKKIQPMYPVMASSPTLQAQ